MLRKTEEQGPKTTSLEMTLVSISRLAQWKLPLKTRSTYTHSSREREKAGGCLWMASVRYCCDKI